MTTAMERPRSTAGSDFAELNRRITALGLGMTFAPNHKGMPHPTGHEDFLPKQAAR